MKYILMRTFLSVIIFVCGFSTYDSYAQTSWQWGKTVLHSCFSSGQCLSDMCSNAVIDKSGNIITGSFNYNVDSTLYGTTWLKSDTNTFQLVITKLDSSGNFLWAKGTRYHNSFPIHLSTDSSDNIYIYGDYSGYNFSFGTFSLSNTSGGVMFFMAKLSSSGTMLWAKNLGTVSTAYMYGGIATDKNKNVYVSTNFIESIDTVGDSIFQNTATTGGYSDFYIAKFDSLGQNLWAKKYGGIRNEFSQQFTLLPNGESFIVFSADSSFYLGSILITSGYYIGAHHLFLAKFNSVGNPIFAISLPNHLFPTQSTSDLDGNLYISGYIDSSVLLGSTLLTSYGGNDAFIAKIDSSGSFLWAKNVGGINNDFGEGITIDTGNNVWIAGSLYASAGYSINVSGHTLTEPTGSTDPLFVIEFDKNGTYLNSILLKSGGDDWVGMTFDQSDNFYLCADYYHTSLIFNCDTLPYPSPYEEAIFIAKYNPNRMFYCNKEEISPINENMSGQKDNLLSIYPNPTTTSLTVSSPIKITQITMTNLLGQTVYCQEFNTNKTELSLADLPKGIYFIKINNTEVRKFVKE